MLYSQAILEDNLSPESSTLYVYSQYLLNGGIPENFMNLTDSDIQLMYTTDMSVRKKQTKDIIEGLVAIYSKANGGYNG